MKHSEYWKLRFEQMHDSTFKESLEYSMNLEKAYSRASNDLNKDIYKWLERIASNNQTNLNEAKKLLSSKALEEFKWTLDDYIKAGSGILSEKTIKQLENASAAAHISHLNAINLQMRYHVEKLYSIQGIDVKDKMSSIFENHYYNVIYEVSSIVSPDKVFTKIDEKQIEAILNRPWASDGKSFSKRIWENQERLVNELQITLQQSFIRGESPDKAIERISKLFDVKKSNASNLVMTESAYFAAEADGQAYKELDVDKYEILATLDMKTSDICQSLDGKVFDMKEYQAGITAPPFHCRCRTTTIPVIEGMNNDSEVRVARDPNNGERYYIPGRIKYDEWKKTRLVDDFIQKGYNKKKYLSERLDYTLETGEKGFVPKGAEFETTKTIAKAEKIRTVKSLINEFGGEVESWSKKVGKIESAKYVFDIHWFEKEGNQYRTKVKKRRDKN